LLVEVDDVVATARAGQRARLRIAVVAARFDVDIRRADLGPHLLGLTLSSGRILLHSDRLRGSRETFVFAHELAHVLCRRGHFRALRRADEEWFADWFARELVLPRWWLGNPVTQAKLAAWGVDYDTYALQLAALGAAPPVMRSAERILCAHCGTAAHGWDCPCRDLRDRRPGWEAEVPNARDLRGDLGPGKADPGMCECSRPSRARLGTAHTSDSAGLGDTPASLFSVA